MQQFFQSISNHKNPYFKASVSEDHGQKNKRKKAQRGQLILEYVLLMILAVGMASLIKTQFIGGTQQDCAQRNAPILSQMMCNVVFAIAADLPSEVN